MVVDDDWKVLGKAQGHSRGQGGGFGERVEVSQGECEANWLLELNGGLLLLLHQQNQKSQLVTRPSPWRQQPQRHQQSHGMLTTYLYVHSVVLPDGHIC